MAVDAAFLVAAFVVASCAIVHPHPRGRSRWDVEQGAPGNINAIAADSVEPRRPKLVCKFVTEVARFAIQFPDLHVRRVRKVDILRLGGINDPAYFFVSKDVLVDEFLFFVGDADCVRMTSGTLGCPGYAEESSVFII